MAYTTDQLRVAEITAKCSGSLSVLGSTALIAEIIRKKLHRRSQRKRQQEQQQQHEKESEEEGNPTDQPRKSSQSVSSQRAVFQNILLGMSIFDVDVIGSWAIPKGTDRVFQPSGTTATCHAQAYLFCLFASAVPLYNLSLALYYYLTILHPRHCKDDDSLHQSSVISTTTSKTSRLRRYQFPLFHLLPIFFGLFNATWGLARDQFNPNELWCWFNGTPQSDRLKFLLYYGPLWIVFCIICILFCLIYRHVRQQERALLEQGAALSFSSFAASAAASSRLSRPVFIQGLLFASVFVLTFLFPTLLRAQQLHKENIKFAVLFMMTLFLPLQGFFNYLVYKKQDIRKWIQQQRDFQSSSRHIFRPSSVVPTRSLGNRWVASRATSGATGGGESHPEAVGVAGAGAVEATTIKKREQNTRYNGNTTGIRDGDETPENAVNVDDERVCSRSSERTRSARCAGSKNSSTASNRSTTSVSRVSVETVPDVRMLLIDSDETTDEDDRNNHQEGRYRHNSDDDLKSWKVIETDDDDDSNERVGQMDTQQGKNETTTTATSIPPSNDTTTTLYPTAEFILEAQPETVDFEVIVDT